MKWIGVLGTHGWPDDPRREWWWPTSPLAQFLAREFDLVPAHRDEPFVWSGDLQGVPGVADGNDWQAGSHALKYYLELTPYEDRNLIAHSHGGQVALEAARQIPIRSLLMFGTPVRTAIERDVAPAAVQNIGTWPVAFGSPSCMHVIDASFDLWGSVGALFGGNPRRRAFNVPGIAVDRVRGIGHTGALCDPKHFGLWRERGWADVLRGHAEPQRAA